MKQTTTSAYVGLIVVNILWGLSFIASKYALLNGFRPFTLAAFRFVGASLLLLPILHKREGLRFPKAFFWPLLGSAMAGITLYFLFEYLGLERTSAQTASLIIAAIPAFSMLTGAVLFRRRVTAAGVSGMAVSLLGVYLIIRSGASSGSDSLLGCVFVLMAVVCWVAYLEFNAKLTARLSGLAITTWQSALGALTLLPLLFTERVDIAQITPVAWLAALFLMILCSVVGYLLYVNASARLDPFQVSLFINLNPLATVIGGALLLGERMTLLQGLGGLLVLIGLMLANLHAVSQYLHTRTTHREGSLCTKNSENAR